MPRFCEPQTSKISTTSNNLPNSPAMSFFGPKNTFQASLLGQPTLHLFLGDDLKKAFDAVSTTSNGNAAIPLEAVPKVMDRMYISKAPSHDVQLLMDELESIGCNESVSWAVLRACFKRAVEKIESKLDDVMVESTSCYSGSHSSYRDAMRRHKRALIGPEKVLACPLTASQKYGWFGDEAVSSSHKVMGKKSCAETIYQSELIKSGVLY